MYAGLLTQSSVGESIVKENDTFFRPAVAAHTALQFNKYADPKLLEGDQEETMITQGRIYGVAYTASTQKYIHNGIKKAETFMKMLPNVMQNPQINFLFSSLHSSEDYLHVASVVYRD